VVSATVKGGVMLKLDGIVGLCSWKGTTRASACGARRRGSSPYEGLDWPCSGRLMSWLEKVRASYGGGA